MPPITTGDALLTEAQTAALIGVSASTLQAKRQRGTGPDFERVGNRVLYNPRTVAAYIRAHKNHGGDGPRHPGRPRLPGRVVELLAAEIAKAHAGHPRISATRMRRLMQAIEPHGHKLVLELCPRASVLPNGSVRLQITPHDTVSVEELGPHRFDVPVDYDPATTKFRSRLAEGRGFDRLCAHVWRLQGGDRSMAILRLLALIGAASVDALAEEAGR
ncbi:helix-turn-helix domain-containing protein [Methylobacterium sp. J-048]|uniref:helix-turn-helix transcriptional regulator n=1 Tax=Methylobacterium sp. J-048 TaxID=2836635 RepID=UPI001FBB1C7D|nr:helix-turn-helix domain-containing protein [Methylobacterium sp. J-048]MCJ2059803.1 helix-turn-helix domain-containing protein [Methylobacterium sp. J-048]